MWAVVKIWRWPAAKGRKVERLRVSMFDMTEAWTFKPTHIINTYIVIIREHTQGQNQWLLVDSTLAMHHSFPLTLL
jgi:hypothetical protein